MTARVHLDAAPDVSIEDGTLGDGLDGGRSTVNPLTVPARYNSLLFSRPALRAAQLP